MHIKNFLIGVAIMILTIFVTVYGINTFYEKLEYTDFCGEFKTQEIIETQERCEEIGGKWVSRNIRCITEPCPQGFCERDYLCRQDYDHALNIRSRNIFFIAIPLGILIIALGAFLFTLNAVGAGLMGGGIGTILFGIGGYWEYADNWIKFIISLLALIILILLAYWFNKRLVVRKKKRKKKKKK